MALEDLTPVVAEVSPGVTATRGDAVICEGDHNDVDTGHIDTFEKSEGFAKANINIMVGRDNGVHGQAVAYRPGFRHHGAPANVPGKRFALASEGQAGVDALRAWMGRSTERTEFVKDREAGNTVVNEDQATTGPLDAQQAQTDRDRRKAEKHGHHGEEPGS